MLKLLYFLFPCESVFRFGCVWQSCREEGRGGGEGRGSDELGEGELD